MIVPIKLMLDRAERYGGDSDSALFTELLYVGEFILKLTTCALVAALEDDQERHRYRILYSLVRADGIGEWSKAIDEILSGPTSHHLVAGLEGERRAFTERVSKNNWQYQVVKSLYDVVADINLDTQEVGEKIALRAWFQLFVELRNKTRGHGAITPSKCAKLVRPLRSSIDLLIQNHPFISLPWAFLHRNLNGKYRVIDLGTDSQAFKSLKTASAVNAPNYTSGVYLYLGSIRRVELIHTDIDLSDYFFPNGSFRGQHYELHSLITDSRRKEDASAYVTPALSRPASETEGKGELDVLGKTFSNLPLITSGYVSRPKLEHDVKALLLNDRHPIVTLVGRGGIGKTSLGLKVLYEIAETERYALIVWFSARDIDLMMFGAKQVRPRVLTDKDIADEYRSLIGEVVTKNDKTESTAFMAKHLQKSPLGPTLFVFDNFETVRSPVDLFNWIDTNIRLPNKVMITSRFRDFKADYPIEVSGMEQHEAEKLVSQSVKSLALEKIIGSKEREQIIEDSDGHPYVIKIVLGEIADAGRFSKPSSLIARKEDILNALFERTYANLSPMAARVFLTLSGWRSLVPQLAMEAILLRHGSTEGDPKGNIDRLVRTSLVERVSASDESDFLGVPLAAALFGTRKLEVHPHRALIENDIRFVQDIGPTASSGLKDGIKPRLEAFFRKTARKINEGKAAIDEMRPVLEFLARGHPPAWLLLAEMHEEIGGPLGNDQAAACMRQYLETQPPDRHAARAWQQLVRLYKQSGNVIGGCGAFLRASEVNAPSLDDLSTMANWLNNSSEAKEGLDLDDRKPLFKPFARLMEQHLQDCGATDLSRLAWLHLHSGDTERATAITEIGLRRDPRNIYCQRLHERLSTQ